MCACVCLDTALESVFVCVFGHSIREGDSLRAALCLLRRGVTGSLRTAVCSLCGGVTGSLRTAVCSLCRGVTGA